MLLTACTTLQAADRLDAISVTATRTERSIFDTPETVGTVTLEDMERDQVQKLSDVLKDMPGVNFSSGPRAAAEKPIIRGLSNERILITVDGARQNFNSGHKGRVFVEPELLKTVDVLRGPGSAVYGSGAMGGVIAMTTKDAADFLEPGEQFGIRLKSGYQSANKEWLGTGIISGVSDTFGGVDYVLSGTRRSSEDIRTGGGRMLENSAEDTWASLAKLGWEPGEYQRLSLSYQYTFDSGEIPAQADAVTSPVAVLTDRETEVNLSRIGYRYHNPNNSWINLNTFIYNNEQTIREKRIGTDGRLDIIDFDTRGLDISNTTTLPGENISQRFTYGLEYYQDDMSSRKGGVSNSAFPDASADFIGAYVQDEITVGKWVLIPGLRYDSYDSEPDFEIADVSDGTSESQVSPKLGLVYKARQWMNLSLNYGRAFRAPSFQELYVSGVHFGANEFEPNPDLQPERLIHGIDAGARMKGRDLWEKGSRSELQFSLYYNEYEDFIDTDVTPLTTSFDNVNEARIHGFEIEGSYYSPGIDAEASFGISYSEGDNLTADIPLTSIPGHWLTLKIEKYLPDLGLSAGARGSFHMTQDRVAPGQPETPGYELFDLFLTWMPMQPLLDGMQLTMGVDNLLDENYRTHLSNLDAAGRNVKLTISFDL